MKTRVSTIDARSVCSLLDRLDPEPLEPCGVAGCEHRGREMREGASAAAVGRIRGSGGRGRPRTRRAAR